MANLNEVTLRVPASTSNCGPGFDTLGIALTLYNFVELTRVDQAGISAKNGGTSPETIRMVSQLASEFERAASVTLGGLEFDLWGAVPPARGLGSSATIRAGFAAAMNRLTGYPLKQHELIRLVAKLDNAPDNVTAAVRGGFIVAQYEPITREYRDSMRFEVSKDVSFVVISPEVHVRTQDAREVLPETYPSPDALASLNSAAFMVGAFASRKYERLRGAVHDFLHQHYRARLCPFLHEAIAAGVDAGAYTGWLSGSGSSVLCMAPAKNAPAVGLAMSKVYQLAGLEHQMFYLEADNAGITPT